VGSDRVPASVGDPLDRRLERRVFERLDLAAVVAYEVVVMLASRMRGLEACDAIAEIDALDEAEPVEPLERPIHARGADA
jgi:hypothetical protein